MGEVDVPQQMEELFWGLAGDQVDTLIPLGEEVGELCECVDEVVGDWQVGLLGEVGKPGLKLSGNGLGFVCGHGWCVVEWFQYIRSSRRMRASSRRRARMSRALTVPEGMPRWLAISW